MDEVNVKGTAAFAEQAAAGLKLLAKGGEVELDIPAATAYAAKVDACLAAMDVEIGNLAGKDNKKIRTAKEKEKAAMKVEKMYVDACKVVKGLQPPGGNFVKASGAKPVEEEKPAPAAAVAPVVAEKTAEKKEKAPKKTECTGISKAERDELEKLKTQIIDRKKELKEGGMSGGQINKDEQIVSMVTRMNELKEKECPGSTATAKKDEKAKTKKLDSNTAAQLVQMEKDLEEYEGKLRTEFNYSKKEIAADPDYCDMKAAIAKIKK